VVKDRRGGPNALEKQSRSGARPSPGGEDQSRKEQEYGDRILSFSFPFFG